MNLFTRVFYFSILKNNLHDIVQFLVTYFVRDFIKGRGGARFGRESRLFASYEALPFREQQFL